MIEDLYKFRKLEHRREFIRNAKCFIVSNLIGNVPIKKDVDSDELQRGLLQVFSGHPLRRFNLDLVNSYHEQVFYSCGSIYLFQKYFKSREFLVEDNTCHVIKAVEKTVLIFLNDQQVCCQTTSAQVYIIHAGNKYFFVCSSRVLLQHIIRAAYDDLVNFIPNPIHIKSPTTEDVSQSNAPSEVSNFGNASYVLPAASQPNTLPGTSRSTASSATTRAIASSATTRATASSATTRATASSATTRFTASSATTRFTASSATSRSKATRITPGPTGLTAASRCAAASGIPLFGLPDTFISLVSSGRKAMPVTPQQTVSPATPRSTVPSLTRHNGLLAVSGSIASSVTSQATGLLTVSGSIASSVTSQATGFPATSRPTATPVTSRRKKATPVAPLLTVPPVSPRPTGFPAASQPKATPVSTRSAGLFATSRRKAKFACRRRNPQ